MATSDVNSSNQNTGLTSLVLMLRFHGFAVDPKQIEHEFGSSMTEMDILRCAKRFELKTRSIESSWEKLRKTPLPNIATTADNRFFILAKMADDSVLTHNCGSSEE